MPDEFDPLYHWLGIPPNEQPANHYRLLGLALYEEHADVIAMAADRQMAHVRTFQGGKRQLQAEELLNQLAAAQICLLNAKRREEYNAQLRVKLAATANAPLPLAVTPSMPPIPPPAGSVASNTPPSTPIAEALWSNVSLKSPMFWQLPLAGLAFVLVLLVGWQVVKTVRLARREALIAARAQTPPVKQQVVAVTPQKPQRTVTTGEPVAPPEPVAPATPSEKETPSVVAQPQPMVEPAQPMPETVSITKPAVTEPLSTTEEPPTFMPPEPAPLPSQPQRRALPTGEALATARTSVSEVYAKELAQAVSQTQRKALAEKMLQDARKLTDDPAGQFAMLHQARTLAIETAQPKLLLEIVNELIAAFDYDPLAARREALHAIAGQLKQPSTITVFAEQCAALVDDAIAQEKIDVAREVVELGIAAANKANDRDTAKELTARRDELSGIEKVQQELASVQAALAKNPSDPDANWYLGNHLCLVKNDWQAGLTHLSQGADFTLAAVALADLKQPTDANERAALGDQWWNFASTDAPQAAAFRHRALHWYKLAEPELKGLAQSRIAQRLADTWTGPSGGPEPAIAPLSAAQARERQVKWAQWLKTPVTKSNKLEMKFMLIPPGQFRMGSAAGTANTPQIETPAHVVRITRPFYISTHEVSVAQYAEFVKATKHVSEVDQERDRLDFDPFRGRSRTRTRTRQPAWLSPSYVQLADHPAVNISWNDAQAFCRWLSQADGVQYSLPTEAQWEYACRAGTETNFSFGDSDNRLDGYAVYAGNSPKSPQRIGQKRPNAWGLRDMHGNVAEWCADWFTTYESSLAEDPTGAEFGSTRAVRGGHWGERTFPRSALRADLAPESADEHIGFRVICPVGPGSK